MEMEMQMQERNQVTFNPDFVHRFTPFGRGAIVFGGHFGDEGKGKIIDILSREYSNNGFKILSIRGQGSGNAGHTVKIDDEIYDFHYLTSAGLSADIMLLAAGMLIDPIRVIAEAKKLPVEKQNIILIDERATMVTDMDRAMDAWYESSRQNSGTATIGTTKSGVGPAVANRGNRIHVTFADALHCQTSDELWELFQKTPNIPKSVLSVMSREYATKLYDAIHKLNIVDSSKIVSSCRYDSENNWAVLLEVSQAMCLDQLYGNGGHFVTSSPCSDIGAAAFAGLTFDDFSDGSTMILKAYSSKVGGGPFITKFEPNEAHIADYIYSTVGECGVTTGRKRDLGWFDGPAVRASLHRTGAWNICLNCMDVLGQIPSSEAKICFAYRNKTTGQITYDWPYFLSDYEPLYETIPVGWDCFKLRDKSKLNELAWNYIHRVEEIIGANITCIGTGGSCEDLLYL